MSVCGGKDELGTWELGLKEKTRGGSSGEKVESEGLAVGGAGVEEDQGVGVD